MDRTSVAKTSRICQSSGNGRRLMSSQAIIQFDLSGTLSQASFTCTGVLFTNLLTLTSFNADIPIAGTCLSSSKHSHMLCSSECRLRTYAASTVQVFCRFTHWYSTTQICGRINMRVRQMSRKFCAMEAVELLRVLFLFYSSSTIWVDGLSLYVAFSGECMFLLFALSL